MRFKACDEIAADTIHAQRVAEGKTGLACRLDIHLVQTMAEEVSERYEPELNLEPILDTVLRLNFVTDEPQRTGYKCVLGLIFRRRMQWNARERRARQAIFDATPFAPREQDRE